SAAGRRIELVPARRQESLPQRDRPERRATDAEDDDVVEAPLRFRRVRADPLDDVPVVGQVEETEAALLPLSRDAALDLAEPLGEVGQAPRREPAPAQVRVEHVVVIEN